MVIMSDDQLLHATDRGHSIGQEKYENNPQIKKPIEQ
jgi:hypothetical protein